MIDRPLTDTTVSAMHLLRFSLPVALALVSTACIVTTTDDDDDTAGTSATATPPGTDSSDDTDNSDDTDESDSTSGTTGRASGAESTGEFVPDCTMCSAEVDPDPLCHSSFNAANGTCECDPGYEWENPTDPNDFSCVQIEDEKPSACGAEGSNSTTNANGDCVCVEGYEWCTTDPDDLTCCEAA